VKFDDGTSLPVAPDALVHQADGSYRLTKSAGSIGAVDQSNAVVIPVVAEELTVEKEQIVSGDRASWQHSRFSITSRRRE